MGEQAEAIRRYREAVDAEIQEKQLVIENERVEYFVEAKRLRDLAVAKRLRRKRKNRTEEE